MFSFPILLGAISYKMIALAAAPVAVGAVSYLLVRGDSRVEARRKRAAALSRLASENGLPLTTGTLESYAVGDYSGMLGGVDALHDELIDPVRRKAALGIFLDVQLDKNLANPDLSDGLMALIEKKKPGTLAAFLAKPKP